MRDKKLLGIMAMGVSMFLALQPVVAFAGDDEVLELSDSTTPQTVTYILQEDRARAASPESGNNRARTTAIILGAGFASFGLEELIRSFFMRKV